MNRSKFTKGLTLQTHESLKHTTWDCKYPVVFIPKCRRKVLSQGIRQELGVVFRSLAEQWECRVEEGHLMPDHVHMLMSVPPSLNMQVRKVIKNRGHFPNEEAASKLIYLALRNIVKQWKRPPTHWGAAAHQFVLKFGERFVSPPSATEKR